MMHESIYQFFSQAWIKDVAIIVSVFILMVGLFQNLTYALQIPLAALELLKVRRRFREKTTPWLLQTDLVLPMSIVIPAYNEGITIEETAKAALLMQYPSFKVIVVNDGSKDDTLQILQEKFNLQKTPYYFEQSLKHKPVRGIYTSDSYPNLVVVDKENGGRSDALNAGIDVCKTPLFCTLDADSILEPSALINAVQPFIEQPEITMATGGSVRVLNGCEVDKGQITQVKLSKNLLALFQVVEYMRAFLMGRLAWSRIGILTLVSGAFSVFRRDIVIDVGGFDAKTIGEDYELVMKIHTHCRKNKIDYQIKFVPEPICWTEVPEHYSVLKSQRIRWQQGGIEVFFKYKHLLFNPKYGRVGMVALPINFIIDVMGPIFELIGMLLFPYFFFMGLIDYSMLKAFVAVFFLFGVYISVMSLILEELSLKRFSHVRGLMTLGFIAVIENFGYRQFNNIWRIRGWWRFITKKQVWGNMTRVGTKN
ncbi:glycosyltransferase [bacterium]|nr:glycosyltransferase [bacterium]